jgi:hypothetical protein
VFSNLKILTLVLLMLGLSLVGQAQTFSYTYIDPCTRELKTLTFDQSTSVAVSYYGQVKSFTYEEISNGAFDLWIDNTYNNAKTTSPCQGVLATTTQSSTTTLSTNVVNTVLNLNIITNLDFSGLGTTTNNSIGSVTNQGTNVKQDEKNNNNNNSSSDGSSISNNNGSSNNQSGSSGDGTTGSSSSGSSSSGSSGSSGNSSGQTSSNGGSSSGQGNGQGSGTKPDEKKPDEVQTDKQKQDANNTTKTTSKAKAETQKPAILVTGDIVGIQRTEDGANDARAMMSYTRVKGDGTASLGFSADFTIQAKVGNVNIMRSWISTNKAGHKHINLFSNQISFMEKSFSNTAMFIRVNSLKNFTALYGAAGSYGDLYDETIINTLAIGGMMYKGKLTKSINATAIAAVVWSPYTKYYTESFLESAPIIVPFLNLQYKLSKSFGVGFTFGGTYLAGENILNYQLLFGGKLIL